MLYFTKSHEMQGSVEKKDVILMMKKTIKYKLNQQKLSSKFSSNAHPETLTRKLLYSRLLR